MAPGQVLSRSSVHRRRRLTALVVLAVLLAAVVAVGAWALTRDDPAESATNGEGAGAKENEPPPPPPPPTLPSGKRRLFPDHRVVAFYGNPRAAELGALGIGTPSQAGRRLDRQAKRYARTTRPVLPAFELISTIATTAPGPDGSHSDRMPTSMIRRYLKGARRRKALLLLDVQPGRTDFFSETTRLERWLREPDVGLALDPEWRVGPGQVPGQVIGSVGAREVNAVTAWLAQLVKRRNLPEKLVVIHQFTPDMVQNRRRLKRRDGLALTFNVDGFGNQPQKLVKYKQFTRERPRFNDGYKLFYKEDTDLMSPAQVMRMRPRPDLVVYE